jgi:hypothetical protein
MKTLKLVIYRHTYNVSPDRNIIGDLHIDGEFFCHTLEDEKRPDGVKIKHETAIPAGKYTVILTKSNRFKRIMPLLVDVPMFSGIRIHGGNDSKDTSGCPLVAHKTDYKKIWQTAEKQVTEKLTEAQDKKQKVTILIKDAFLSYDKETKTPKPTDLIK